MKYLLLCALVITGAFFSTAFPNTPPSAGTGVPNAAYCPDGLYLELNGQKICYVNSDLQDSCQVNNIRAHDTFNFSNYATWAAFDSRIASLTQTHSVPSSVGQGQSRNYPTYTYRTHNLPSNLCGLMSGSAQSQTVTVPVSYQIINQMVRISCTWASGDTPSTCTTVNIPNGVQNITYDAEISLTKDQHYKCPPNSSNPAYNIFVNGPIDAPDGTKICYVPAQAEPECDCANFAGQNLNTRNTLRAPKGQYTNENPPQCVMQQEFVAGRDTPLTCTCQVSAQKWMKTNSGFENGVEYDRWETLPTTQGQPSGTFTGVKCGATDGGPLEPENNAPKECFTLPNGVRWCWADKAEKCQVVNGLEQCASGCGTVNGDFVCYDDKPVIPPKDRDQLTPPDDTLADPNKPINEMVKSDFKEVNKGVETRLDNVVTSISNTTIAMDEVSDKVGLTNSKLDGIGMQLDGVGKQLGAIDGKLEGAFGDKGQPMPGTGDGKNCHEEVCSWYESAYPDGLVGIWEERSLALQQTALFDFINQFSFEPSGSQPDMQLCFNIASWANFGCFTLEVPTIVWLFVRVCILFTAAMLCRALIFGG